ncbi:MAG: class I SAM-dependent methyltransferase [Acidobacteria bacterium]|nr:class I SAM-dependent methyltransferase [Acidobacteriota bacterium]MBI3426942.1 class I SAM-dependent methyltransferase [Acidobacteriota bacterium]
MDQQAREMKLAWDKRAAEDARWYINTVRRQQTEEEFDASGRHEVQSQVVDGLALLTGGSDPRQLRLLEIGCGIGRMTKHLAGIFGEVYAVDVSAEMIRQAQMRLQSLANVRLFETGGEDFALFPAQSFDVIFSAYVFQHVPSAAIIRSNLVDAWRVLKPGGVCKFVTNGVTAPASGPTDSWHGAAFPEAALRQLAEELGAQLLGLFGEETQYCWTMLRRRMQAGPPARTQAPQVVLRGHTDDLSVTEISLSGARPYLTLVLAGEFSEWDDAASVKIEVAGRTLLPRYAGPPGTNAVASLRDHTAESLFQVNLRLPPDLPIGEALLHVSLADSSAVLVKVTLSR